MKEEAEVAEQRIKQEFITLGLSEHVAKGYTVSQLFCSLAVLHRQQLEAKDARIRELEAALDQHAWTISPAMAQAKIDELPPLKGRW